MKWKEFLIIHYFVSGLFEIILWLTIEKLWLFPKTWSERQKPGCRLEFEDRIYSTKILKFIPLDFYAMQLVWLFSLFRCFWVLPRLYADERTRAFFALRLCHALRCHLASVGGPQRLGHRHAAFPAVSWANINSFKTDSGDRKSGAEGTDRCFRPAGQCCAGIQWSFGNV